MTGGVAKNRGVHDALAKKLKVELTELAGADPQLAPEGVEAVCVGDLDAEVVLEAELVLVDAQAQPAVDALDVTVEGEQHGLGTTVAQLSVDVNLLESNPLLPEQSGSADGPVHAGITWVDGHVGEHILTALRLLLSEDKGCSRNEQRCE